MLTHTRLLERLCYDQSTGIFTHRSGYRTRGPVTVDKLVGSTAGTTWNKGRGTEYITISIDGTIYLAHRLAWLYVHGSWPDLEIDHINGNGLDNRIENLRKATSTDNRVNSLAQITSKSGHRGIHKISNGRYRVQLQRHNKSIHVGYFTSIADAIAARDIAAVKVHGEYARIPATAS